MLQIPPDGLFYSLRQLCLRQPAQFFMNFRGINGIAAVVAFSVRYIGNKAFRFTQFFEDELDQIYVCHFIMAADVVEFTDFSFLKNQVDGAAVVFYVEPVPYVFAVSINGNGLTRQGFLQGEGNEFFRKLVGAVVVAAAGDGNGKAIGAVVGAGEEIGTGFGAAVGGAGAERGFFCEEEVRSVQWKVSIDFVGGNLVEAMDMVFYAGIHEDRGTDDICFQEYFRIQDGAVHMGFGSKVDNYIRMFFFKDRVYGFPVADIYLQESEAGEVQYGLQGRKVSCIGELVQADDAAGGVFFSM